MKVESRCNFVGIEDAWTRIRADLGLEDVHFHDFRHTFGTIANENGSPLRHIGGALGQTAAKTTQRYAHQVQATILQTVEGVGAAVLKKTKA